jgi:hypothetical protein
VGGQPANREAVRAYAKHHLKLPDDKIEAAVDRILREEVGEREVTGEGEVKERESYGLNVLRRDDFGPWVGDWQIKAALKQSASRVGLFAAKRGTKGDMAEMGRVSAVGNSLHGEPFKIHLLDADGERPATTFYRRFMGRVQTPDGPKSIVTDAECAPVGTRFSFRFQWYEAKLTEADMVKIFSAFQIVGLGSAKAMEQGKVEVMTLEIETKRKQEA